MADLHAIYKRDRLSTEFADYQKRLRPFATIVAEQAEQDSACTDGTVLQLNKF